MYGILPMCRQNADVQTSVKPATSCTRPSGWLQAADWWPSSECAVAAFSVVVLEPGRKCLCPLRVAGECLPVGPFSGQSAIESLDLAVLPRAVRFDELLRGPQFGADAFHLRRMAVGEGVVGEDPFDAVDALGSEVSSGSAQKVRAGDALFIGKNLEVGQA